MSPIPNVSLVARIEGDVSEEKLRAALESVRLMHPLIGSKVILDTHHEAWFSSDNVPGTILRITHRKNDTQWFDEIRQEHMTPLDPITGPLVRFVLVYSPDVSDLIIFAAHTICDGTALATLVRDILERYTYPDRTVTVIQPPMITDYLKSDSRFCIAEKMKGLFIAHFNRKWRKQPYFFDMDDYNAIHAAYWERFRYHCVILEFNRREASDLISRCRTNGVTITSAITAAFLAAAEEVIGPLAKKDHSVAIPFDLRRHLGIMENCFCYFVGGFQFTYSYNQNNPFWENARVLQTIIKNQVQKLANSSPVMGMEAFDPALLDAWMGFAYYSLLAPAALEKTENLHRFANDTKNIAWKLARDIGTKMGGMIMTNLGRVDILEHYGPLRLDRIYLAPCAAESVPLICAGAGVSGRITFTANYVERIDGTSSIRTDTMIDIRNRALEHLGFPENRSDRDEHQVP